MTTLTTRGSKGSELTHNELDANFNRDVQVKTTTYACLVSDNRSVIECNHASTPFTVTLGDAATMAAADTGDYEVTISNIGAAVVTVARAGSDTIDGAATSITLNQYESVTLKVNAATDGYNSVARGLGGLTANVSELNILDGVTATAAELNALDGITSTVTELNILDGVTATTAEINKVDGVTGDLWDDAGANGPAAETGYTLFSSGLYYKNSTSQTELTYNTLTGITAPSGAKGLIVNLFAQAETANSAGQRSVLIYAYSDSGGSNVIGTCYAESREISAAGTGAVLARDSLMVIIPVDSGSAYVKFASRDAGGQGRAYYSLVGYTM